jgi:hypothetical protein
MFSVPLGAPRTFLVLRVTMVESLVKLRVAAVALFPAASWCATEIETLPWLAEVKSRLAVQEPLEQLTVALALPLMTTFRVSSEHVPETANEAWLDESTIEFAAGELIVTVGAVESLIMANVAGVAALPAASV